jgi:hypothetical protein
MEGAELSTDKPKRGRKPAIEIREFDIDVEARIEKLQSLVIKLASLTGNGNMLRDYGFEMWTPGKQDMSKYKL